MFTRPQLVLMAVAIVALLLARRVFRPMSFARFDHMNDDARAFLTAFVSRFSPPVVTLVDEPIGYSLTPSHPDSAPVSITVKDRSPIVVVSIGAPEDEVVLEWMADLDTYDAAWWDTHVGPIVADVAAGRVRRATWNHGPGHQIRTEYAPWAPPN